MSKDDDHDKGRLTCCESMDTTQREQLPHTPSAPNGCHRIETWAQPCSHVSSPPPPPSPCPVPPRCLSHLITPTDCQSMQIHRPAPISCRRSRRRRPASSIELIIVFEAHRLLPPSPTIFPLGLSHFLQLGRRRSSCPTVAD